MECERDRIRANSPSQRRSCDGQDAAVWHRRQVVRVPPTLTPTDDLPVVCSDFLATIQTLLLLSLHWHLPVPSDNSKSLLSSPHSVSVRSHSGRERERNQWLFHIPVFVGNGLYVNPPDPLSSGRLTRPLVLNSTSCPVSFLEKKRKENGFLFKCFSSSCADNQYAIHLALSIRRCGRKETDPQCRFRNRWNPILKTCFYFWLIKRDSWWPCSSASSTLRCATRWGTTGPDGGPAAGSNIPRTTAAGAEDAARRSAAASATPRTEDLAELRARAPGEQKT